MSDSEKEDVGRTSPISSRHEKSLGLLTAKFVEMLKNAEGGLLDLKKVFCPVSHNGRHVEEMYKKCIHWAEIHHPYILVY